MNKSVAIVEDNTDIRVALEQIIEASDEYTLAGSCISGEEALVKLPILNPKVVLMDIGLGGISGIEVVRELKASHPDILFMMCTIYDEDEKIFEALSAGASGYILKKTSPAKLLEGITELIEGGAPMSSQIARKVVAAFQNSPANSGLPPTAPPPLQGWLFCRNGRTRSWKCYLPVYYTKRFPINSPSVPKRYVNTYTTSTRSYTSVTGSKR